MTWSGQGPAPSKCTVEPSVPRAGETEAALTTLPSGDLQAGPRHRAPCGHHRPCSPLPCQAGVPKARSLAFVSSVTCPPTGFLCLQREGAHCAHCHLPPPPAASPPTGHLGS